MKNKEDPLNIESVPAGENIVEVLRKRLKEDERAIYGFNALQLRSDLRFSDKEIGFLVTCIPADVCRWLTSG